MSDGDIKYTNSADEDITPNSEPNPPRNKVLVINVGNTHTNIALYGLGYGIQEGWRVRSDAARTTDEWGVLILDLIAMRGVPRYYIHGCIMSSVVPAITQAIIATGENVPGERGILRHKILVVTPDLELGIRVDVENPQTVGTDRLVNAAAAYARWGGPCIVVDMGTATTFDVVDAGGAFIGGAITPGLHTLAAALTNSTAQLPRVPLVPPPTAIGRNTVAAIQSGVMRGYAALIEGLVAQIRAELGPTTTPIPVIATGGLAYTVAAATSIFTRLEHDLTLDGLWMIYERNVPHEVPRLLYSRKRQP
ncbi:MAG: type III pantothenate kinase [Chloroflexota bacterium]|nr:type III pantothenate kinase [Chloroflexota bacterium]